MQQNDDDMTWLILLGAAACVLFPVSTLFDGVRAKLLEWQILVDHDLIIAVEGAGLDLPRVAIVIAVVGLIVYLWVRTLMHRAKQQGSRERV
ncbi:hypothetical protein JRG19_09900 [Pseudoclavibacter alba]|uniref:hypothetical protein n=1 Tax=Pseudoclavibacter albus TaxID=272241 RepID=UPI0019D232AB|nr:hypothetical protein [Pseudoclavibacter alba]MBN6778841.1 hypothetical protein [Pseudoclavibacter alba]